VAVFGRKNHLDAEPGTSPTQPEPTICGRPDKYPAKAGKVNRHTARYTSRYSWSRSVRWCLAGEWI